MRLGARAETLVEWLGSVLNLAPRPLADTHLAFLFARIIMAACRAGLFDALVHGPLSADAVAAARGTNLEATRRILCALVAHGYLRHGERGFRLTRMARKWLTSSSPVSLVHKLEFQTVEWRWMEQIDAWLAGAEPVRFHGGLAGDEWGLYQNAMRDLAGAPADELIRRVRLSRTPEACLDLGGAHGMFAAAFCRHYPGLSAMVLDLPQALGSAATRERSDRIIYRAGDALRDDLGVESFDLVVMANLAHHFEADENKLLFRRISRALRREGSFVLVDIAGVSGPEDADTPSGRIGSLLDVHFGAVSRSSVWPFQNLRDWLTEAGLAVERPMRLRSAPGSLVIAARRLRPFDFMLRK